MFLFPALSDAARFCVGSRSGPRFGTALYVSPTKNATTSNSGVKLPEPKLHVGNDDGKLRLHTGISTTLASALNATLLVAAAGEQWDEGHTQLEGDRLCRSILSLLSFVMLMQPSGRLTFIRSTLTPPRLLPQSPSPLVIPRGSTMV